MRWRQVIRAGLGIAAAGAAAVTVGEIRWRRNSDRLVGDLIAPRRALPKTVEFARELNGLPPVVARYFQAALRDGQPMIAGARVRWRGEFNMGKPGRDNWRPFTAEQDFNPAAPGFVWKARIGFAPGVPVLVRDAFVVDRASMRGAILGLVPVVNAEPSPDLASGALQRYLGEAVWLPTGLLPSQGVSWSAIDDTRARATLTAGATTVSLEFTFNSDGLPMSLFTPSRMMDDGSGHAVLRPWEARMFSFTRQDGMVIPDRAAAVWHLPGGDYEYWRGAPVDVDYEFVR